MKKIKHSIKVKSVLGIVLLLVGFAAIVSAIGYNTFTDALLAQYADGAFRIAEASVNSIDASKLDVYLLKGGSEPGYLDSWTRLDKLCNGADFTFIYVIQPDTRDYGHITFLFSTVNHNSEYTPYPVGYVRETTNDEYRMKYERLYKGESERELLLLTDNHYTEPEHHLTAMVPLRYEGETKGILCVQRQMGELVRQRAGYVRSIFRAMLLVIAAAVTAGILFLNKSLLLPVRKITEEASRFARENEPAGEKLSDTIRNRDEIGLLATSIDTMEEQVLSYVENLTRATAERERISTELSLATRIQAAMLPDQFPPFPDRKEFDIYASMDPARAVGGDFYDFFLIDSDHLGLVIADVSGKSVPAALFMMASKIVLADNAFVGKSPAQILADTNNAICANNREEMFVTVWLGILEISTGRLTAANAGHEYPALKRADGSFALLKEKHGLAIGAMEGSRYREYELDLMPGDVLFVYTDGVPEAATRDNAMFGTDRMIEALNRSADTDPEAVLQRVRLAVEDFVQGAEQFDDLTMLCVRYNGK